ncbi:MAG: hypothetical protein R2681_05845 [Pyrinomonadaceae bacterium]
MSSINGQTESASHTEILGVNMFDAADSEPGDQINSDESIFQLGLWLSGLESFLALYNGTLAKKDYATHDWTREFSLIHSILLRCSKHTLDLANLIKKEEPNNSLRDEVEIIENLGSYSSLSRFTPDEFFELSSALKESILLSEGLLRATSLGFNDWTVWNNSLISKIKSVPAVQKLINTAEMEAGDILPDALQGLLAEREISSALEADLKLVLPYFARILKWLSVIGTMLDEDLPLKPALLLFARINEQMREMMDYINNRLMRYPNEEDELFGSLDSAAYTASIELRKVYDQELRQLIAVRPAPLVFAKIENSYSLLNDSLQLTLVNFARLIDPAVEAAEIFPEMKRKEEQSVKLREDMWDLLQSVQDAEHNPEKFSLDSLHKQLKDFGKDSIGFIFYKDIETVERFIEEIILTKDKKDLVPILHRFGAYLETLLGQVNMRAVLIGHPFAPLVPEPQEMFV